MQNKNQIKLLKEAIVQFENTANQLINLLCEPHELDLSSKFPFEKITSRKKDLWKGKLKGNWNYQFHGDACQFLNEVTGQVVNVKVYNQGNYKALTSFYLLKFIETTVELAHVNRIINSQEQVVSLMNNMLDSGELIYIGDKYFPTIILDQR